MAGFRRLQAREEVNEGTGGSTVADTARQTATQSDSSCGLPIGEYLVESTRQKPTALAWDEVDNWKSNRAPVAVRLPDIYQTLLHISYGGAAYCPRCA